MISASEMSPMDIFARSVVKYRIQGNISILLLTLMSEPKSSASY